MNLAVLFIAKEAGLNLALGQTLMKSVSIAEKHRDIMNEHFERTGILAIQIQYLLDNLDYNLRH